MSMYSNGFKGSSRALLLLLVAIFLACVLLADSNVAPPEQNVPDNSAAVIAIITGGAVLIERLTETIWILVGMKFSTRWPLKSISGRMNAFAAELDGNLSPYLKNLKEELETGEESVEELLGGDKNRKALLSDVEDLLLNVKTLQPDSAVVRSVTNRALGVVSKASETNRILAESSTDVRNALDKVNDFLITLEDNPGRRLTSIMLGVIIAVPFAGILGLDVFQATLGIDLQDRYPQNLPIVDASPKGLGVALTGVIMGLGATPTHEVIKTLQEIKKNRKSST